MPHTLAIASDHAGYSHKAAIAEWLQTNYQVHDFGPMNAESVDYPDYAHKVAMAVQTKEADLGILFCGSGNGVAMAANKHQGIRAALCWADEVAGLARQHNNANIICVPARFMSVEEAKAMITVFLKTDFEGGGRHERRVEKIDCA